MAGAPDRRPRPTCTRSSRPPALPARCWLQCKVEFTWASNRLGGKKIRVVLSLSQLADRVKSTSQSISRGIGDSSISNTGVMRSCWVAAVLAVLGLAR